MLKTCAAMRQKRRRPATGESSQLSSQGGDSEVLPSPTGGAGRTVVATRGPGTETDNIKQLLSEFKQLHEQRLETLEMDTSVTAGEALQRKMNFLRSYVKDLTDQNQVLAQTVEDLQKEADHSWEMKLRTPDHILNVSEADLRTLSLDELVGPVSHISHSSGSSVQIASEFEGLTIQLQTKDMVISNLEKEPRENFQQKQTTAAQVREGSERLVHLQSELSCLQRIHKDNMKEIAEKDVCITKLQATIQLLQHERAGAHAQLFELGVRVRALKEELKRKEEEWRLKYEMEHQKEEESRRQEQHKREGEWVRKVEEEKKREEEWKNLVEEERKAHAEAVKTWAERAAVLNSEAEAKMASLRGELGALFDRRVEEKEVKINQLTEELNGAKQKLQTSECLLSDISETLDQTQTSLSAERRQKRQIQDQYHHANKEMERLQQELTRVYHTAEKKLQKREVKMCALVKELTESKKQLSEGQQEVLCREKASEELCKERDELRAKMEDWSRESVHLNQTKERLEADLALSHEKLLTSHLEVRSRDQFILQLRAEMKTAEQKHQRTQEQVAALEGEARHLQHKVRRHQEEACQLSEQVRDIKRLKDQKETEQQLLHDQLRISQQQVKAFEATLKKQEVEMELLQQQLKGAEEELKDTSLQAQRQKETIAIFKQKYTAAIEKVNRVQGQVELLEEELQYSQQQLRESQSATHSVKDELAEMAQRYQEKLGQWENSQEALDLLTDELQVSQNLLRESERSADHLKGLMGSAQEQVDTLKQQKLMLECDLRLYQQSHSHSDDEYLSLRRHRQQLQKCCTEQVERLAECEKAILQMKSELERQSQEKEGLKQSLVTSHHTHMSNRGQLEQEVIRLKKEATRLELKLADTQTAQLALLRQSEEELKDARREAATRSSEVDVHRGEVQRLREELQKQEGELRCAIREKPSLSSHIRQLSQELEELRSKHQVTVEELAARAEEARRMEGCLKEGKLAEEKIRSMAVKLEIEVAELRRNLQQTVDHKLKAEREKQEAQDQVETLRSELESTRSNNAKLRHESQLVMTNVSHWISEQQDSNESLSAQMTARNKALLIVTTEKEHLQEANDTLKAEVKRLKEVADERERDTERFKAQIRDRGIRQDERTTEKQGCVALNLRKIEDMQTRLRSNLEAIGMLNQQLNALSRENKRLRRQLEEERSLRRRVERPLPPPPSQRCSPDHLPLSLSARPPPPSCSLPSSLRPPHPLSLDAATVDIDGILTHTMLSAAGPVRPGESQALGEALWISPAASRGHAWSRRRGRDRTK